ncbi:class I adenylate-forming enzyme family protein [Actinomadura livida]|uniref:AMP-binding protein n=1 Tax=Actinomadura livida TaxID=79909 RepID=A0A7W7MZN5_9ACTN|nr:MULTISPECIES: AMP-binding protein [Actinomadura]MBB4776092.1 acyl-CoA synthetase (AMP-forming)/AMP-acid ligase II [Actinomadura catellatispora]GGU15551.1 long-chain-fatty-acid--CoA ligase [Actinomadura livida]
MVGSDLGAGMRAAAERFGAAPLVFHGPRGVLATRLDELHRRALRVAAGLAELGIAPGDVVAVQLTGRVESAVAQAAVLLRGAVVLPIVPIYGLRELRFVLHQSAAAALITWDERAAEVRALSAELPGLQRVLAVGDADWKALEAHPPSGAPEAPDPDGICVLVYTSGTTAEPKGVQHTHRSMLAELATMPEHGEGYVYLDAFPPGHVAGLCVLLRALVNGTSTVFMERWDAETALDLVHEHGVTASAGVPFHLAALLDAAERSERGAGTLREYLVGAASVPPVLVERAERAGIAAYRAYGSSEHPTISSGGAGDPAGKRATTDGTLKPGTRVRIVDLDGNDVPVGEEGEIWSRGPEVFAGYRDPALNAQAFTPDGWLRTGDVGRLDPDGHLTVTDRLKDIIVRGGEKISSKEVEDMLAAHPAVAEAVAVAEPDERYGERVCAFAVLRAGEELDLDGVRRHFASLGAARQKTPERLVVVDALPRTAAGKVRKHVLREEARAWTS